jgi:hypothetical protein
VSWPTGVPFLWCTWKSATFLPPAHLLLADVTRPLNDPFTNPIEMWDLKLVPPEGGVGDWLVDAEGDLEVEADELPPGRQLGTPPGGLVGRHVSALGGRASRASPRALDDNSIAIDNTHTAKEKTSAARALPFCFMGHPPFYVTDLLFGRSCSRHEDLSPVNSLNIRGVAQLG